MIGTFGIPRARTPDGPGPAGDFNSGRVIDKARAIANMADVKAGPREGLLWIRCRRARGVVLGRRTARAF